MSEADKPKLTARDLSFHVATAGADAKKIAAEQGGDPAQLRSLVEASRLGSTADSLRGCAAPVRLALKGFALRSDDLLVTLCFNLHMVAFGVDPRSQLSGLVKQSARNEAGVEVAEMTTQLPPEQASAQRMKALAVLGFIFTQAEDAWEILDLATSAESTDDEKKYARRDFNRAALEFGGSFKEAEIETLLAHLLRLARQHPPADEDPPGKQEAPAP